MTSVAKVFSVAPIGFDGHLVEVESDATRGLPPSDRWPWK
jgi:hypothetical protein